MFSFACFLLAFARRRKEEDGGKLGVIAPEPLIGEEVDPWGEQSRSSLRVVGGGERARCELRAGVGGREQEEERRVVNFFTYFFEYVQVTRKYARVLASTRTIFSSMFE